MVRTAIYTIYVRPVAILSAGYCSIAFAAQWPADLAVVGQ